MLKDTISACGVRTHQNSGSGVKLGWGGGWGVTIKSLEVLSKSLPSR